MCRSKPRWLFLTKKMLRIAEPIRQICLRFVPTATLKLQVAVNRRQKFGEILSEARVAVTLGHARPGDPWRW
jgi:hypothetical protein